MNRNDLNQKLNKLLKLKLVIQKLEFEQAEHKKARKEAEEKVRSLGQQIGELKTQLFESI